MLSQVKMGRLFMKASLLDGGFKPEVEVCNLMDLNVLFLLLFSYEPPDIKLIALKSRRYCEKNKKFTAFEANGCLYQF